MATSPPLQAVLRFPPCRILFFRGKNALSVQTEAGTAPYRKSAFRKSRSDSRQREKAFRRFRPVKGMRHSRKNGCPQTKHPYFIVLAGWLPCGVLPVACRGRACGGVCGALCACRSARRVRSCFRRTFCGGGNRRGGRSGNRSSGRRGNRGGRRGGCSRGRLGSRSFFRCSGRRSILRGGSLRTGGLFLLHGRRSGGRLRGARRALRRSGRRFRTPGR